jgi:hypothetical protein
MGVSESKSRLLMHKPRFTIPLTLLFLCVAASPVALAQVTIFPVQPRQSEVVRVQLPSGALGVDVPGKPDSYDPTGTEISMVGNVITVSLLMIGNSDFELSPSQPVDIPVGSFPAGDYVVQLIKRSQGLGSSGPVGSSAFHVSARSSAQPLWDFTDLWWTPAESGWGFNVTQHPSGIIFATWFVYAEDGTPTWYFIPEGSWTSPYQYRGPIYKSTGPFFGGVFNPSAVTVTLAGSAILGFDSIHYDRAVFVLTADGKTVTKQVQRQSF